MIAICDIYNIVRHYTGNGRFVSTLSNGETVLEYDESKASAYYCDDDDTYWPLREAYAGQPTYQVYEVDEVPEGADVGITRYNTGKLEIDSDLKQAADAKADAEAKAARVSDQAAYVAKLYAEQQTDEAVILTLADLYDEWQPDTAYTAGKILSYGKDTNGDPQLYKVAQAHTSQADWTPDKTPALYSPIGLTEGGVPIWRQPTGAHDAYNTGDQCVCDGYVWTSKIDGNTTRPGSDDRWWEKGEAEEV